MQGHHKPMTMHGPHSDKAEFKPALHPALA